MKEKSNNNSYRALITQRQYCKLIGANLFGRFGDSLDAIAYSWLVYQVTGNAAMMAVLLTFNMLPCILLQPFAGVWADRLPKRQMMLWCDIGRAVCIVSTVLLYFGGLLSYGVLILLTLLQSSLEAFRMPAGNAFVPFILDKEHYDAGLALNASLSRVVELVGTAAAGGLVALFGCPVVLLIDGGCFLLSAFIIGLIRYQEAPVMGAKGVREYGRQLLEGVQVFKGNKMLRAIVVLGGLMNFINVPFSAFQTPYVAQVLQQDAGLLSAMGVAFTGGMGLGSFFTPKLKKRLKGKYLFLAAGLGGGMVFYIGLFALPYLAAWIQIPLLLTLMLLFGFSMGLQGVLFSACFMSCVEQRQMGRVSALTNALLTCIVPVGSLLSAAAAEWMPLPTVFLLCGLLLGFVYLLLLPRPVYDQL